MSILYTCHRVLARTSDVLLRRRFPAAWQHVQRAYLAALRQRHPFVELEGVRVRMSPALPVDVRRDLYDHLYEHVELAAVRRTLEPDDVVLELGTGLGVVAAFAARRIGSERVFTFDGNPALASFIRDTFAVNGVSPTFETCILGAAAGESTLFVDADDFRFSSLQRSSRPGTPVRIASRDINAEMRRIRPTFLIMDIEGSEYDIVRCLEFDGLRKLLIEVHDEPGSASVRQLKAAVMAAGFDLDAQVSTTGCLFFARAVSGVERAAS